MCLRVFNRLDISRDQRGVETANKYGEIKHGLVNLLEAQHSIRPTCDARSIVGCRYMRLLNAWPKQSPNQYNGVKVAADMDW